MGGPADAAAGSSTSLAVRSVLARRDCQRLTYESRRHHRDKFWEVLEQEDYVERAYLKYKPARGRKG